MKMCEPHWAQLRSAIDERGLGKFVAEDGKQALDHTVRELSGEASVIDFEPLLGCHNMLMQAAMQHYGMELFMMGENGEHRCPVCMLEKFEWINAAADSALDEAKRRGLIEDADVSPEQGK